MLEGHKATRTAKSFAEKPVEWRKRYTRPIDRIVDQSVAVPRSVALAHDARNILAALQLYCDLLEEPGVLTAEHRHYAEELRAVSTMNAHCIEELAALASASSSHSDISHGPGIKNVVAAVHEMNALLTAIAGPCIDLEMECLPCSGSVQLTRQDLKRILINLVRNAVEAMPKGGRIRITVQKDGSASFLQRRTAMTAKQSPRTVLLCVHDNGPGISSDKLAHVFNMGFTTRMSTLFHGPRRDLRRGLGLSIVRNLVETAGGHMRVLSSPTVGTCFEIELPLTNVTTHMPQIAAAVLQGDPQ